METRVTMRRDDEKQYTEINIVLNHSDMIKAYENLGTLEKMTLIDGDKSMTGMIENARIWMKAIEDTTPANKTRDGE